MFPQRSRPPRPCSSGSGRGCSGRPRWPGSRCCAHGPAAARAAPGRRRRGAGPDRGLAARGRRRRPRRLLRAARLVPPAHLERPAAGARPARRRLDQRPVRGDGAGRPRRPPAGGLGDPPRYAIPLWIEGEKFFFWALVYGVSLAYPFARRAARPFRTALYARPDRLPRRRRLLREALHRAARAVPRRDRAVVRGRRGPRGQGAALLQDLPADALLLQRAVHVDPPAAALRGLRAADGDVRGLRLHALLGAPRAGARGLRLRQARLPAADRRDARSATPGRCRPGGRTGGGTRRSPRRS